MFDDRTATPRSVAPSGNTSSNSDATNAVGEFFDEQQERDTYRSLKAMTRELDMAAARIVNDRVRGDVLSIGGVWDWFEWRPGIKSMTVLDLSARMLEAYCPTGATRVEGDLYTVQFPRRQFDTIVFPLVLHHTARDDWSTSQRRVRDALARADQWLRPGGAVVIVEYCAQPVWAAAQRLALPVTKRFLRLVGQPLVIMQSRRFYESALIERFATTRAERVEANGFDYGKWYPVFMGVRWLRVPLTVYPRLHVLIGESSRCRRAVGHVSSSNAAHSGDAVGD